MTDNLRLQLEKYIDDWHSDIESYESALIIGKFLFSFMNYLGDEKIGEKTRKEIEENVYLLGMFECQYGYNNDFYEEDLECIESYEDEFKRKIACSTSDLKFYKLTWEELKKYVSSKKYEEYLGNFNEMYEDLGWVNDVVDFTQMVRYLEIKEPNISRELNFRAKKIEDNYIELEDCISKEEYNKYILKAWEETNEICKLLESIELSRETKSELLKKGNELTTGFYSLVNN